MNLEFRQLLDDWKFIRQNTVEFIVSLSEEELTKKMPRLGLDTFMKHFEEMCDVEMAYLDACEAGEMRFDCVKENDEYLGVLSRDEILAKMKQQDQRIDFIIEKCALNNIVWDEEDIKTLNSQLRNLCIHETLHLGQMIAFAYVMDINIPDFIVENWALS